MSRRFLWLALAIVAVIALYTAGWFYAAQRLVTEAEAALDAFSRNGNRAVCEEPEARGYPFRIGLFCRATYVELGQPGLTASTGQLRSAGQIYDPFRIVAEADAPARLTLPRVVPLDLDWETLRISARLDWPLPERVSIQATMLNAVADLPGPGGDAPAVSAADAQLHLRPAGADLEIGIRFAGLQPAPALLAGGTMPPLDGVGDIVMKDAADRLLQGSTSLRGTDYVVRQAEITTAGGAKLSATGTMSIGPDGLIDADLSLAAGNIDELAAVLTAAFPLIAPQIGSIAAGLSTLGGSPSLPLTIRDGQAALAFFRLGTIPPL